MTVESVFERISGFLTDEALVRALIITFAFCLGCFILAALFRLIFGKRSTAVASVTITLDILVLYMAVVLLPLYVPNIDCYLPTLPFSSIGAGYIEFMVIPQLGRDLLAAQIIDLLIIAFLFGLTETLLPEGKNIFTWLLLRILTIVLVCTALWIVHTLSTSLLPGFIQTYAPVLLLAFITVLLALTVFKWFFGLILGMSCGPFIGAIYTFVVGNIVGKQLAKAALTCILIVMLLMLAYHKNTASFNLGELPISFLIITAGTPIIARYSISKLF